MQKIQDWLTQQWVILWGRKIDSKKFDWLMGPFGGVDVRGEDFIQEVATKEKLTIERDAKTGGLIPSISSLKLSEAEQANLSSGIIDFYENTVTYNFYFSVRWNPFFRVFGVLINWLFSNRLKQLNIPTTSAQNPEALKSELITLTEPISNVVKYTFWFRSILASGQTVYSGIYGVCTLPCGRAAIKAIFPLPNGNATVLMTPSVSKNGELVLNASGKKFGDPGFYFLLKDAKGGLWSNYIQSFCDRLTVRSEKDHLSAEQVLTLWGKEVLRFNYLMEKK